MLYSCTHMATVGVKGIRKVKGAYSSSWEIHLKDTGRHVTRTSESGRITGAARGQDRLTESSGS